MDEYLLEQENRCTTWYLEYFCSGEKKKKKFYWILVSRKKEKNFLQAGLLTADAAFPTLPWSAGQSPWMGSLSSTCPGLLSWQGKSMFTSCHIQECQDSLCPEQHLNSRICFMLLEHCGFCFPRELCLVFPPQKLFLGSLWVIIICPSLGTAAGQCVGILRAGWSGRTQRSL